jgi:protein CrcB
LNQPVWRRPGILLAVAAGGLVGTIARYELALEIPARRGAFPMSTFVINVTGSFVLGILLTLLVERWRPHEYIRPLLATGLIGAYTTWSTFVVDADDLIKAGHAGTAGGAAVTRAQRLTLYLDQTDRQRHVPLYVEIVDRARRTGLAGATVVQGTRGFGASTRVHHAHVLPVPQDVPVVVTIVDTAERIDAFIEEVRSLLTRVVVLREDVDIVSPLPEPGT